MEKNKLSGIERELVLQYLIDGNVPVIITPVSENGTDDDEIHSLNSEIYSIAIEAEHISVLKEGIILLQNVSSQVVDFEGKKVKVEFYFNKVGLYFITEMKTVSSGPALVIPNEINRIEDVYTEQKYDFYCDFYYSVGGTNSSFRCYPATNIDLFTRPIWSSIQLEKQQKAKEFLEKMVPAARKNGRAGNGIQLINVCKYFVEKTENKIESIQGRLKPFNILFVNHERIVLGFEKNEAFELQENQEYALNMAFSMKDAPSITRNVFVTFRIDNIYSKENENDFAADCSFTSLKEEDCRFLYEKATSNLFI